MGLPDIKPKGKVLLVGSDAVQVFFVAPAQFDLGEHRVAVEKQFGLDPGRHRAKPAGSRDVHEKVSLRDGFLGQSLVGNSIVSSVGLVPVNPTISQIEFAHNAIQIAHIVRAIRAWFLLDGVVSPVR